MNVITILCDTLRRDHCGPYHHGVPLSALGDQTQPDWIVPTPNIDRLAAQGTVFDNAWCGSHPCVPARRDMYTGRFDFPFRGWAPLEDTDLDLPTVISGPSNTSLRKPGLCVSQLVTDHFHLWERGAGNYHMGYSGFEFIRGMEADAWKTDPVQIDPRWERYGNTKLERHFRNLAVLREGSETPPEDTYFPHRTFATASEWIDRNHTHESFYLHIDSFPPHEPWDPPERLVKQFDPRGYDVREVVATAQYAKVAASNLSAEDVLHIQAVYAASVVHVDESLGMLWDALDRHGLWQNTVVMLTSDHGTFNGSRQRVGKLQTHLFDPISHIPFIIAHPTEGHGERRSQLVQLVDLYSTTLSALNKPIPEDRHGVDLLPVISSPRNPTRKYAINGMFGESMSITDGSWMLHIPPVAENAPLFWYSHHEAMFIPYNLGPFECTEDGGRRRVERVSMTGPDELWLSNLQDDPHEMTNLSRSQPAEVIRLAMALASELTRLGSPPEHAERLGLVSIA